MINILHVKFENDQAKPFSVYRGHKENRDLRMDAITRTPAKPHTNGCITIFFQCCCEGIIIA